MESIIGSIISGVIVAAVVSFVFNRISKRQERHEKDRTAILCSMFEVTDAHIDVTIATALAVRDRKCNGEMSAAIAKMEKVRQKQAAIVHEQVASNF